MAKEEELKRLRAAVASDGAYHEIGFTYETENDLIEENRMNINKEDEPEDEPYQVPAGLNVPKGIHLPSNTKIHAIIEKTALFVSQQGGQMEIIIKMKQCANPQFAFMHLENPLHPYYKNLVKEIKGGHYKPAPAKKPVKDTDDDSDDDHYLHPSLMSGKVENVPKFTVPSINFRRTDDDSYSILVKNLRQQIVEDSLSNSPQLDTEDATELSQTQADDDRRSTTSSTSDSGDSSLTDASDDEGSKKTKVIVPPPPDIQPIIDKMAEYVAKNGEDFEFIVKSKNDKRFDFLHLGNKYYHYYLLKRNSAAKRIRSEAACLAAAEAELQLANESEGAIATCEPNEESCVTVESAPVAEDSIETKSPEVHLQGASSTYSVQSEDSMQFPDDCVKNEDIDQELEISEESTLKNAEIFQKSKHIQKVIKGPISFSLKSKDNEAPNLEKTKKTSLLLGDSEGEEETSLESKKANPESDRKRRHSGDQRSNRNGKVFIQSEGEERVKKLTSEELEAKMAEERIKDKLASAARERLAQQKRDKQLQLERKRRAAIFLKMLKKNTPKEPVDNTAGGSDASLELDSKSAAVEEGEKKLNSDAVNCPKDTIDYNYDSPTISEITSPRNGVLYTDKTRQTSSIPPSPISNLQVEEPWSTPSSSSSTSDSSDNEMETETLIETSQEVNLKKSESNRQKSKKKKKKKKSSRSEDKKHKSHSKSMKHSHSGKHKSSHTQSKSHKHKQSRSPSRKGKTLPAAYAMDRRSRSKSRSPKRYRSNPRIRSPTQWIRRRP